MKTLLCILAGVLIAACLGCLGCAGAAVPGLVPGAQVLVGGTEPGSVSGSQPLVGSHLASVPFALGRSSFARGDAITIEQVLATSPYWRVGDKVVVRGAYTLASEADAVLALYVTGTGSGGGRSRSSPTQRARVTKGSGEFELACEIPYEGQLHVSFYPSAG